MKSDDIIMIRFFYACYYNVIKTIHCSENFALEISNSISTEMKVGIYACTHPDQYIISKEITLMSIPVTSTSFYIQL